MKYPEKINPILLLIILAVTFSVFFADGYRQWVNSDTASEAHIMDQDIRFPQGLFSEEPHHARITANLLSFVPFQVAGPIYRGITDDPVNSLYFSQGVMTGTVYLLLVLISAAYVSSSAMIFTRKYLFSALLTLLFAMALTPIVYLREPFGMSIRFSHQAVMTNYVGATVFALAALFPYWRYVCTGKWHDFYQNPFSRTLFYVLLLAAVFSSSAITIWLGVFSGLAFLTFLFHEFRSRKWRLSGFKLITFLKEQSRCQPLLFIMGFGSIAILSETTTPYQRGTTSLGDYLGIFGKFFTTGEAFPYVTAILLFFLGVYGYGRLKGRHTTRQFRLWHVLFWFLAFDLIYIFLIGMPATEYRFENTNLGRDTIFPAVWATSLIIFSLLVSYWSERKHTWIAPLLLFVLLTNALNFFSFPYYRTKGVQKEIFDQIYRWDRSQPREEPLGIYWTNLAFSRQECEWYTIPMLRRAGIISPKRKVVVLQ